MHLFLQWPYCTICFLILAKIWIPLLIIQTLYPRIPNFDYDLSELKKNFLFEYYVLANVACDLIGEECDPNFIFWVTPKCVLNLTTNNRDKEREG